MARMSVFSIYILFPQVTFIDIANIAGYHIHLPV